MRVPARPGIITLALAVTLSACSSPQARDPFGASAGVDTGPRTISLYAQNENKEDVVIYVLSASGVERVGSVAPDRARTFFLDWDRAREVRVRVEILAGPRYTTNSLPVVAPGDRVEVWVPRDAERSFIRRR